MKSLLSHKARIGTYFSDCEMQLLCKIFVTVFWGTLDGKILKILVLEIILCQICVDGAITWKM